MIHEVFEIKKISLVGINNLGNLVITDCNENDCSYISDITILWEIDLIITKLWYKESWKMKKKNMNHIF